MDFFREQSKWKMFTLFFNGLQEKLKENSHVIFIVQNLRQTLECLQQNIGFVSKYSQGIIFFKVYVRRSGDFFS